MPVLEAAEDRIMSWSLADENRRLGVSGVVDLDEMETVAAEVIEAFRLLIEPAIDGLGMAVEAVEVDMMTEFFAPFPEFFTLMSSWALFK